MSLEVIDAALAAARQIGNTLRATDKQLKQQHAETESEIKRVCTLPEPRAELLARIDRVVDQARDRWRAEWRSAIVRELSMRITRSSSTAPLRFSTPSLLDLPGDKLSLSDLCGLAPELVRQSLREIVTSADYTEGLVGLERGDALVALDEKLAEIEESHLALVDRAAQLDPPIRIQPIPAAQRRRMLEERAREEREQIAADMARARERWDNAENSATHPSTTMADGQNYDRLPSLAQTHSIG